MGEGKEEITDTDIFPEMSGAEQQHSPAGAQRGFLIIPTFPIFVTETQQTSRQQNLF